MQIGEVIMWSGLPQLFLIPLVPKMLTTGEATWQVTAIAFIAQFLLTLVAYGSGAPGGLFAPVLILGASLGYLVGLSQGHLLGVSSPVTYALAGMGTFFGAVVRVPITGIVIVFEMTTDFNLVLPLMIGSATAYLVAEKLAPGSLYERLLEWRGIHLESTSDRLLTALTAADVMQRRVETLTPQMSLAEAVQAFSRSQHHHFPVVQEGKSGRRTTLLRCLSNAIACDWTRAVTCTA